MGDSEMKETRRYKVLLALATLAIACSSAPAGQTAQTGATGNGTTVGGATGNATTGSGATASGTTDTGGGAPDAGTVNDDASTPGTSAGGDAATTRDAAAVVDARSDASGADGATTAGGKPTIFYLEVAGQVMTADAENPTPRTLVSSAGSGPDGIAVDLPNGHIYWTNMGVTSANDGYIRRSDLDGSNVITVVPAGGTFTPKQMKLEPLSGKLYWSDREGMQVQRANLDGSAIEVLVTVATGDTARANLANHCVGMAVDAAGGWFYWTQKGPDNGGVGSIRRAHIQMPAGQTSANRNDIEILFSGLPEPIDLDLDVAGGIIYWADRGDDTISRAPVAIPAGRTAADRTDRQIIVPGVSEAIGVAIDKARGRLYYTGASGQLGRANLDGSNKQELTGAGAMTGIVIVDLP